MAAKLTIKELTGLSPKQAMFVIEYIKDFSPGDAAERAGYSRATGPSLVEEGGAIMEAVGRVLEHRLEAAVIDAAWLQDELVDNHVLARQSGKLSASNTALKTLGTLATIDAFAAEKVTITSDEEIRERLLRGRKRAGSPSNDEVDFK